MAQAPFLYGPNPNEDLEEAYRFARLSPDEQIALRSRLAQRGAEQGAEQLIRGAAGLPDSPSMNREKAGQEIRALALKVTPGTPEFYTQAADILRKHGLVSEAEVMTQRLHDVEYGKGETQEVQKLQRVKDQLVKRFQAGDTSVKAAIDAIDRKLATYGESSAKAADPEFIRLMNAWTAETDPVKKDLIKKAVDAWIKQKEKAGGDMTPYQAASLLLRGKAEQRHQDKDDKKEENARAAVVSSLQATVRALDSDIQAAQRLLVHPGLAWITGRFAGVTGRLGAAATSNAAGAHALLMTVHAQTFIRALQDLKATSKNDVSGLGQLTEKEGDKIQNAKVALDPQQPTEQFKRTLQGYLNDIQATRTAAASALSSAGAPVPPPPLVIVDRPAVRDIAPGATPTPPAPKPAADKPKRTFKATKVG